MRYAFLIDTYETERLKVLVTWSTFAEADLARRQLPHEPRARSVREHMVHQCVSEDLWFKNLGVDVEAPPLPASETRNGFIERYAQDSARRLEALRSKSEEWWEETVDFYDTQRTRCWIMTRRISHTAHHRGQQTILARVSGHSLHSTYGPTADTGGLFENNAPTIYPYGDEDALLQDIEKGGGGAAPLPGPGTKPPTERP